MEIRGLTMDKQEILDMLFPYVAGELTEEEKNRVEKACRENPELAKELELTRMTARLLTRRRQPAPGPFFWTRLSARLDRENASRKIWIWTAKRLIPSMVAATLIIGFLIGYQTEDASVSSTEPVWMAYDEGTQSDLMSDTEITNETLLESVIILSQNNRQE
jgi:anti-sigma factor RsiW